MMISIDIEFLYVAPAIRKAVAEELLKRGMKQKEIASLMNITSSAVNQYLKNKRANNVSFNEEEKKIILNKIPLLIDKKTSIERLVKETLTKFEKRGCICRIHESLEKINCDFKIEKDKENKKTTGSDQK